MDCNIIDYNPYNIFSNNNLYFNLNLLHKYDRELTLYKIDDGIQDTFKCLHFLDKNQILYGVDLRLNFQQYLRIFPFHEQI